LLSSSRNWSRATGLEALDGLGESEKTQVSSEFVRHFLEGVRKAPGKSHPSPGMGEKVQFEDNSVSGASRGHGGRVLPLSAFSHNGHKNDGARVLFKWFFPSISGKFLAVFPLEVKMYNKFE